MGEGVGLAEGRGNAGGFGERPTAESLDGERLIAPGATNPFNLSSDT
jgi:hypothetical protein